ncbi:hypothetical protein Bca4012_061750 [Brassica carinata]
MELAILQLIWSATSYIYQNVTLRQLKSKSIEGSLSVAQAVPVTVPSGWISASSVAPVFGRRLAFDSGVLTFFSSDGRLASVSVSHSSFVLTAALHRILPIPFDLQFMRFHSIVSLLRIVDLVAFKISVKTVPVGRFFTVYAPLTTEVHHVASSSPADKSGPPS